jgi:hypothetical protein
VPHVPRFVHCDLAEISALRSAFARIASDLGPVTILVTPEYAARIRDAQALKGNLLPEDVARIVLFLAADDSSAMTSQNYIIDGGWV